MTRELDQYERAVHHYVENGPITVESAVMTRTVLPTSKRYFLGLRRVAAARGGSHGNDGLRHRCRASQLQIDLETADVSGLTIAWVL